MRKLEGDLALVGAVAARGEPDHAHAAPPELAFEGIGADLFAGERREGVVVTHFAGSVHGPRGEGRERIGGEARAVVADGEDGLQVGHEVAVRRRQAVEPGLAAGHRLVERLVEQAGELRPELGRAGQPAHA